MRRRLRRLARWLVWLPMPLALACAPLGGLSRPSSATHSEGVTTFRYDDTPDPVVATAVAEARGVWLSVGVTPPRVTVVIGVPTGTIGAFGMCYCTGDPADSVIVVRAPRPLVIAHELGHAMGLRHVEAPGELMHPTVGPEAWVGPATLREARRAGVLP